MTDKKLAHSRQPLRLVLCSLLVILVLYLSTCSLISNSRARSFDEVTIGEELNAVLTKLGSPSKIEMPGELFARYASKQCSAPCIKRLWYENHLALDIEALSVEFDANDVVVNKTHWSSP